MKALVVAGLLLTPTAAFAQTPRPCDARPNVLLADLGLHVVNVGYQRTVGCHVSLQVSAGLYGPWTINGNVLGLGGGDHSPPGDVIGAVGRLRAFFYLTGDAPGGLWVSPFVQGGPVFATRGDIVIDGSAIAAGASVGYAFTLGQRFLLSLGLGVQYNRASFENSTAFPGFSRVSPTVDINVGYRL